MMNSPKANVQTNRLSLSTHSLFFANVQASLDAVPMAKAVTIGKTNSQSSPLTK